MGRASEALLLLIVARLASFAFSRGARAKREVGETAGAFGKVIMEVHAIMSVAWA
jgi:hypothetical protein